MNILVLYALQDRKNKTRQTILDSLYCFSRYDKGNKYYYFNVSHANGIRKMLKDKNQNFQISGIIIHYSMIAQRVNTVWWQENKNAIIEMLKGYNCVKIIIPQDEYSYTDGIREIIKEGGVHYVYTIAEKEEYSILYPADLIGDRKIYFETVYTGYIDEKLHRKIKKKGYNAERKIDIGYRARKLSYALGKHSQLKVEVAEVFLNFLKTNNISLVYDIENTNDGRAHGEAILGNDWIKFLLNCRVMLGCLGGSSLMDSDGSITKKVEEYCLKHPKASFEEVEEQCFKGLDYNIHIFSLGPRHFECAMTKTCQVLIEGNYGGVFRANIDYIEVKKDFSNLNEVIKKIMDVNYCEQIAENCYQHVVLSQKYTYAYFVERVVKNFGVKEGKEKFLLRLSILCSLSNIQSIYTPRIIRGFDKFFCLFEKYNRTVIYKFLNNIWKEIIKKIS